MVELNETRAALAIDTLTSGLRDSNASAVTRAVSLAEQIIDLPLNTNSLDVPDENDNVFSANDLNVATHNLRRINKLTQLLEGALGVDLANSRINRVALRASTLSSLGSLLLASNNLYKASDELYKTYQHSQTIEDVPQSECTTFYRALAIFGVDCMLFASPLNYRIAWRTTRYLNNHYLYKLRGLNSNLYRYTLSEAHFAIREITPMALRQVTHLIDYLTELTMTTYSYLKEFGGLNPTDATSTIYDLLNGFQQFIIDQYSTTLPTIDLGTLATEIANELIGIFDGPILSNPVQLHQVSRRYAQQRTTHYSRT